MRAARKKKTIMILYVNGADYSCALGYSFDTRCAMRKYHKIWLVHFDTVDSTCDKDFSNSIYENEAGGRGEGNDYRNGGEAALNITVEKRF